MINSFDAFIRKMETTPKGVIHIGANEGLFSSKYEKYFIDNILWIEKSRDKMISLYENTKYKKMFNKFLNEDLSKRTFGSVYKENIYFLDLDEYDTILIEEEDKKNIKNILLGFENLFDKFYFKNIIIKNDCKFVYEFLLNKKYTHEVFVEDGNCVEVLYRKKEIK